MDDDQEKEKLRSPNYPAFGLSAALERAKKFYEVNGKASVTTLAAVKAWGYNTLNGRSLRALGALRQFGLLDDTGPKMVKISQNALVILLSRSDSLDRLAALRKAARNPTVYAALFDQYQDGIPGDDALISDLEMNSAYSGDAASTLVAGFRDTITLIGGGVVPSPSGEDEGKKNLAPEIIPDKNPKKGNPMPDNDLETLDYPIPLVSGGQAILRVPRNMPESDYTVFSEFLASLVKGIKAAVTAPQPKAPTLEEGPPNA